MDTLMDANQALSKDLPRNYLKQRHWQLVAKLVIRAETSGSEADIRRATDGMLFALLIERWADPGDPTVVTEWHETPELSGT